MRGARTQEGRGRRGDGGRAGRAVLWASWAGSCWPCGAPSARTRCFAVTVTALATPVLTPVSPVTPSFARWRGAFLSFLFCFHRSVKSPLTFREAGTATAGKARGRSVRDAIDSSGAHAEQDASLSLHGSPELRGDVRTATAPARGPSHRHACPGPQARARDSHVAAGDAGDVPTAPPDGTRNRPA